MSEMDLNQRDYTSAVSLMLFPATQGGRDLDG